MTIKELKKQAAQEIKILRRLGDSPESRNLLQNLGYKKHRASYDRIIYSNDKTIVKFDVLICGPKPKNAVATIYDGEYYGSNWAIQPKCDRKNNRAAFKILKSIPSCWDDPAIRNCGWLNGKPVIFDW